MTLVIGFQRCSGNTQSMENKRMKHNSLDGLSQDFFVHKLTSDSPARRPITVWLFFGLVFFPLVLLSVGASDGFPGYINLSSYAISALHGLYIIPCIFFSSRNRIARFLQGFITATMYGSLLFQLEFWMTVTILGMALTCTSGGNVVDPAKGYVAFALALMVLFFGIITNVLMLRRMKCRILAGHFQKNGSGFWGDRRQKKRVIYVLTVIAPVLMSFGSASVFIGKFWNITWDEAYAPLAMIIAPLLAYALLFVCAYGNTYLFVRKYYVKRFGIPEYEDLAK